MKRTFITFFRNAKNNPKLFLINLFGFSIGITAVLFIYLYAYKEISTDRFHTNHKDIYRVLNTSSNYDMMRSSNFLPLGELLQKHYPEIENFIRISEPLEANISTTISEFSNQNLLFVDRTFFEFLDFSLGTGDYNELFDTPNGLVISKELANQAFESPNPVGEEIELTMPGLAESKRYTVTGVLNDIPEASSFHPQLIANISYFEERFADGIWSVMGTQLFLYMPTVTNPDKIASQISQIIADERNRNAVGYKISADKTKYQLQPFSKMYMNSLSVSDEMPKGDFQLARIMIIIGLSILMLIWLNYIILNMGVLSKNKSFGQLHFILGGSRGNIFKRYLQHALLFSFLTFPVVLCLYPLVYNLISSFAGYRYSLFEKSDFIIFGLFVLVLLIFALLSGTFQYVFSERLSGTNLSENRVYKRKRLFNALIQFQLVVFIVLLSSMFFVNRQVKLIRQSDLGFDTENTFSLSMQSDQDLEVFRQEFNRLAFVKSVTHGEQLFKSQYRHEDVGVDGTDRLIESQVVMGDHKYIEAYAIDLLSGRNLDEGKIPDLDDFFNMERKANTVMEVLVNEEFVRKAGLENPVGKMLNGIGGNKAQIVGVIADVRNLPIYYSQKPMVIGYDLAGYSMTLTAAVMSGYEDQFLAEVREFYKERDLQAYFDRLVFKYDYAQIYQSEDALRRLIQLFSSIVLVIMVLGLVGLSLYLSGNKTKEIGIRKVNGAKVSEILSLLNKDFIKWVIIAFIIATPIAYYAMNKWLENFAYKTTLSWWIFALAGVLALGIALLTVIWQSWRAATRNPVEALRYE